MKEKLIKLVNNRALIYGLLIVACIVNGVVQTYATYDAGLGMGDNSTFYAFARNISRGEIMYKDFIHFRTPGTVTLFGTIMSIAGEQRSTLEIATRIETLILYPLIFLISAMIIFRKKSPLYVVFAFAGIAFLPGVAQLRAAFGLLAIAIYTIGFGAKKYQNYWLLASGFLASVTFFFGQEIALMVGLCIIAAELACWSKNNKPWKRLGYITGGVFIGIVPLLIYTLVFSSISNFLYYTTYYSFILQPKFMNIPFPELSYANIIFFLPFIMYWLCFVVLYTNKKLGIVEGLLLSFGILRLITAVGRSDFGHFLFAIPEVFIIVPYLLIRSRDSDLSLKYLKKFAPFGLALFVLFYLSTHNGIALALVPFVILFAVRDRLPSRQTVLSRSPLNYNLYLGLGSAFILFLYILTPTYISIARAVKNELFFGSKIVSNKIGGVRVDEITYNQIKAVEAVVKPIGPKTIFAFPIQPFYYSFADKHASRFLTFEPQTTIAEQKETIEDLERTKPGVIIFDPLQAQGLSGSLWKISDYITSNYEIKQEIASKEILWVMVPKNKPARDEKLVFSLYHNNVGKNIKTEAVAIHSTAQGLINAISQARQDLTFKIDNPKNSQLQISVLDRGGLAPDPAVCGVVEIKYSAQESVESKKVCSNDGVVKIDIKPSETPVSIVLKTQGEQIIWNNPSVVE